MLSFRDLDPNEKFDKTNNGSIPGSHPLILSIFLSNAINSSFNICVDMVPVRDTILVGVVELWNYENKIEKEKQDTSYYINYLELL